MDKMSKLTVSESQEMPDKGEYAVKRSPRATAIALLVCLLLAFVVWFLVMNAKDIDYIAVDTATLPEGYSLSVTELEVTGTVAALRNADKIALQPNLINGDVAPGTYTLNPTAFVLPEGVELESFPTVILTVEAQ